MALKKTFNGNQYINVKYIHQILISDDPDLQNNLSSMIKRNISSIKNIYKSSKYTLWTKEKLRIFIKNNFSSRYLNAYDNLSAYTAKSDFGRYCLLLVYGGLYSDLSNRFFAPLPLSKVHSIACFRDVEPYGGAAWAVTPTILYSEPAQDELRLALDMLVANVEAKHYGVNPLCPTGPVMFGRALAVMSRPRRYWMGQMMAMSGTYPNRNHVFVTPNNHTIAIRMQSKGGNVALIGLKGGNDYNVLWRNRRYFSERGVSFRKWIDKYNPYTNNSPSISAVSQFCPDIPLIKRHKIIKIKKETGNNVFRFVFDSREMKDEFEHNWSDIGNIHPELRKIILKSEDIRNFISANFSKDIIGIYDTLPSYILKANLACLAFLLVKGGLYFDVRYRLLNPFSLPRRCTLGIFRADSPQKGISWSVNNAIIRALPDQEEIRLAFELTVALFRQKNPDFHNEFDDAAAILGRALAIAYRQKRYWCGETIVFPHTASKSGPRYGLIAPNGTMIAVGNNYKS